MYGSSSSLSVVVVVVVVVARVQAAFGDTPADCCDDGTSSCVVLLEVASCVQEVAHVVVVKEEHERVLDGDGDGDGDGDTSPPVFSIAKRTGSTWQGCLTTHNTRTRSSNNESVRIAFPQEHRTNVERTSGSVRMGTRYKLPRGTCCPGVGGVRECERECCTRTFGDSRLVVVVVVVVVVE
jgi:hypothetical protein